MASSADTKTTDGFSGEKIAKLYNRHRPSYPDELYSTIWKYCDNNPNFNYDLAVDVGCGSGQSTRGLLDKFSRVIALDSSEHQIEEATLSHKHCTNVSFRVGMAEDLSFIEESSVDLVTFAACFFWLDHAVVCRQVKRILKPGGVIVLYGYKHQPHLCVDTANDLITAFVNDVIVSNMSEGIQRVASMTYEDIQLPFEDFQRDYSMSIRRKLTIPDIIGYYSSGITYQKYERDNPDSRVLHDLEKSLVDAYNAVKGSEEEGDLHVEAKWSVSLLLGRN